MPLKKPTRKKGNKNQSKSKIIFIWLLKTGGVLTLLLFLFLGLVWLGLFGKIPGVDEIRKIKNQTASVVYSSDGVMIGKYYYQNRLTIDNKTISRNVKNALVATEDSRFFDHKGLDFVSLARVVVKTVILGNRKQGGGSTISQQLAKNLYLTGKQIKRNIYSSTY